MLKDFKLGKKGGSLNTIITILFIVVIIAVAVKIYKATKATANVTGQAIGNEVIATQLGMSTSRVVYIRSEAQRLWRDGVTNWLVTYNYDEEMFIAVINEMVTQKEVMLLDQLFQEQSGKRLKDVIESAFNNSDKAKLNQSWLAVLST